MNPEKELEIIESIIDRLEKTEYTIRGWLIALITGLTIALYSGKTSIDKWKFIVLGLSIIIVFLIIEILHRVPKLKAFKRADEIEKHLRGEIAKYDGPKIHLTLSGKRKLKEMLKDLIKIQTCLPYILLMLFILSLGLCYYLK